MCSQNLHHLCDRWSNLLLLVPLAHLLNIFRCSWAEIRKPTKWTNCGSWLIPAICAQRGATERPSGETQTGDHPEGKLRVNIIDNGNGRVLMKHTHLQQQLVEWIILLLPWQRIAHLSDCKHKSGTRAKRIRVMRAETVPLFSFLSLSHSASRARYITDHLLYKQFTLSLPLALKVLLLLKKRQRATFDYSMATQERELEIEITPVRSSLFLPSNWQVTKQNKSKHNKTRDGSPKSVKIEKWN